jgi:hypothetical protein
LVNRDTCAFGDIDDGSTIQSVWQMANGFDRPLLRMARPMKRFALTSCGFVLLVLAPQMVLSQTASEERAVMKVVERLFDAMRAGDSAMARSAFHADARLIGTAGRGGKPQLQVSPIDGFIQAIGAPHEHVWDERIWGSEVRIDGPLATVWTHYAFYLGDRLSHCGADAFQLFLSDDGWKIVSLVDSRRAEGCTDASRDR